MTTGSGKKNPKKPKTPKKPKSGKASASRGKRKKVVAKTPESVAVDKEKMAAFFSAAGVESEAGAELKAAKKVAAKKAEDKVSKAALGAEVSAAKMVASAEAGASERVAEGATSEDKVEAIEPGSGSLNSNDNNNNGNQKGDSQMTTNPKTSANGTGSGSFNTFSMFFVLLGLALFWFYFISSNPQQKAAAIQVEQGKAEILTLTTKIKALETANRELENKLKYLKKVVRKYKKAAQKVNAPLTIGVIPAKKAGIEAAPEDSATPAPVVKRDSSFEKAPTPFWRNMGPHGSLIKKAPEKIKPEVKAPAAKVDSFSKALKPFWLTPRVKPAAVKVEKSTLTSVPPAGKCPFKHKKALACQDSASTPALDPSFKKAPKPFWVKD